MSCQNCRRISGFDGNWFEIIHIAIWAVIGVCLLSFAVQGWLAGHARVAVRVLVLAAGLFMIAGGWMTDAIGVGLAVLLVGYQKRGASVTAEGN
ncbi:hypothetical protein [Loktanella sp. 5RATIMAR09]|uniref:hypothetical protein n=1 Tax=Loktanella sp. 5RATIMAR09 TaxID=1225655 RepID=UPI0006EB69F4|nr:hypothetical protein [Loktanella sp. 5RATIMAR09]